MKKPIFFAFILSAFMLRVTAQNDSLAVPAEEKYDSLYKQEILNQEKQINHLWKLNVADIGVFLPTIAYETRIGKSFSSETSLGFGVAERNGYYGLNGQWNISQQLKYYFNLNRREKMGRYTNGFNANYISLSVFAGEIREPKPAYKSGTTIDGEFFTGIGLNYGMQRRIGNFGFFEPYFGLSYQFRHLDTYNNTAPLFDFAGNGYFDGWVFNLNGGLKAGFSIEAITSKIKYSQLSPEKVKVNSVWKLNLVGITPTVPNFGFEFRLFKNLTSDSYLKYGIAMKTSRLPYNGTFPSFEYFKEYEFEQLFKYYYNLSRREASGKSINGFAGNYFSLGLFARSDAIYVEKQIFDHFWGTTLNLKSYGVVLKYGLQRRLGDLGFIDFFAGIKYQNKEIPETYSLNHDDTWQRITTSHKWGFNPFIGIRIGFALDFSTNAGRLFKK